MGEAECKTCNHPRLTDIEGDMRANKPLLAMSKEYGLSRESLRRHWKNHLSGQPQEASPPPSVLPEKPKPPRKPRKAVTRAEKLDVMKELEELYYEMKAILEEQREDGATKYAIEAAAKMNQTLTTIAKILGELKEVEINVLVNPQWVSMRQVIIDSLEPYPEARQAVLEGVKQIEEANGR